MCRPPPFLAMRTDVQNTQNHTIICAPNSAPLRRALGGLLQVGQQRRHITAAAMSCFLIGMQILYGRFSTLKRYSRLSAGSLR